MARWIWRIVGLGVVLLAAGLVFLVADASFGRFAAWAAVGSVAFVLPLLLARLLLKAFRRIDADARYLESASGLAVVCAIGAMLLLGFVWRAPLAHALEGVPRRHPSVPRFAARLAEKTGVWIAPAPAPHAPTKAPTKAPAKAPAKPPAKAPPRPAVPPRPARDAGVALALDAGTPPPPALEPDGGRPAAPHATGENVRVCASEVKAVWLVDLGGSPRSEIVVLCAHGYIPNDVRVLWIDDQGRLIERTDVPVYPPADRLLLLAEPRLVDVDEDGAVDMLLGAVYLNHGHGPRGGDTWWMRGTPDGQFRAPVRLVGSSCAAIDAGDIDGDGHVELVVVHYGNPWMETRPEGEVRWFERTNLHFRMRGHQPVLASPDGIQVTDVNGDGKQDVVVHHEDGGGAVVLPGTDRGLGPMDPSLLACVPEAPTPATGRLDDDEINDRVEAREDGMIRLTRSAPSGSLGSVAIQALDHRDFPIGTPPAADVPDAGADEE